MMQVRVIIKRRARTHKVLASVDATIMSQGGVGREEEEAGMLDN